MVRQLVRCVSTLLIGMLLNPMAVATVPATFDAQAFDATVTRLHQESGVPGLAVAVLDNGTPVFTKGYGIAGPDKRPVTVDTVFQIGSITKAFVALVIQQMAAEGQLNLQLLKNLSLQKKL